MLYDDSNIAHWVQSLVRFVFLNGVFPQLQDKCRENLVPIHPWISLAIIIIKKSFITRFNDLWCWCVLKLIYSLLYQNAVYIYIYTQSHSNNMFGYRQLPLAALASRPASWRDVTLPLLPNTRTVFQFSFRQLVTRIEVHLYSGDISVYWLWLLLDISAVSLVIVIIAICDMPKQEFSLREHLYIHNTHMKSRKLCSGTRKFRIKFPGRCVPNPSTLETG